MPLLYHSSSILVPSVPKCCKFVKSSELTNEASPVWQQQEVAYRGLTVADSPILHGPGRQRLATCSSKQLEKDWPFAALRWATAKGLQKPGWKGDRPGNAPFFDILPRMLRNGAASQTWWWWETACLKTTTNSHIFSFFPIYESLFLWGTDPCYQPKSKK